MVICYMNELTKAKLRSKFKNIRNSINKTEQEEKSKSIAKRFIENFSNFKNYFVYINFLSEVQTGDIIKYLLENNKNIAIPKCNTQKLTMYPTNLCADDFLTKNTYGILENNTDDFFDDRIDVILLPALTVDRQGNRLGFGKGYYDKFINSLNYKPILVALCYEEQISSDVLPNNEYDVRVDYIITDTEIIKIGEK